MNIVITGGTSGIGEALVRQYASDHRVFAVARSKPSSEVTNVTYYQADVGNEQDVRRVFTTISETIDTLDLLINNAGIYIGNDASGIEHLTSDSFESEWRVNTLGVFLVCKYAYHLLQAAHGTIINITSNQGMFPDAESIGYATAKAATNMFTKSLALSAVKDSIRVNAVCPGPIDTPMLVDGFNGVLTGNPEYEAWIARVPQKRAGSVEDIVQAVCFLADPQNTFVTGSLLVVDGGMSANSL